MRPHRQTKSYPRRASAIWRNLRPAARPHGMMRYDAHWLPTRGGRPAPQRLRPSPVDPPLAAGEPLRECGRRALYGLLRTGHGRDTWARANARNGVTSRPPLAVSGQKSRSSLPTLSRHGALSAPVHRGSPDGVHVIPIGHSRCRLGSEVLTYVQNIGEAFRLQPRRPVWLG